MITQGKWNVRRDSEDKDVLFISGGRQIICSLDYKENKEANAQAISCLPDMIEALRPFAALCEISDKMKQEPDSTCEWRIKKSDLLAVRAALQKAGITAIDGV